MSKYLPVGFLCTIMVIVSVACSPPVIEEETTEQEATPDTTTGEPVTLTQSTITWETYQYELTDFNTIKAGTYDGETRMEQTFDTWLLENEYLRVTLLPDYGGRILSIIYKPTGHEQLYQNPVGVPYQIDTNVFYYNWLIVYGGIFPTFPEPEHDKAWFMPWDFEVVEETDEEITISMSYTDDDENVFAPPRYDTGITGLTVTYYVTLKQGRAALDTLVHIENPTEEDVRYEYWTNTTLAPGSDPADPRTTAEAEIIAPVDMIKIPSYWQAIAAEEKPMGLIDVYEFNNLRLFENWSDLGIAYAFPDIKESNFWGVINHANGEGIFRIADNTLTPGLKIWTWGYPQTAELDPQTTNQEARPYIELWAGVTREFFQRTELPAGEEIEIEEIYSPSVGLTNVTHANADFLINMDASNEGELLVELFGLNPSQTITATLTLDDAILYEETFMLDAESGNTFQIELGDGVSPDDVLLTLVDEDSNTVFEGRVIVAAEEDN